MEELVEIEGVELRLGCGACPEAYDAYKDGVQVAYLRLRHGYFAVHYPDYGGHVIYEAYPNGDGIFEYEERAWYLNEAVRAINNKLGA